MGQSVIASCGPIVPDIDTIPSNFTIRLHKMPFSETRLIKFIGDVPNHLMKEVNIALQLHLSL